MTELINGTAVLSPVTFASGGHIVDDQHSTVMASSLSQAYQLTVVSVDSLVEKF